MSERVENGRWTTSGDDELVLFLVSVRVNRLRAVREWLPVVRQMRPMVRELENDPDSGLLGYHQWPGRHELTLLQYWASTKQLFDFAHGDTHRGAWLDFYRKASASSAVGIWHETFVVPAGRYESIYGNVPRLGIAGFRPVRPIRRRLDGAAARLGEAASATAAVPSAAALSAAAPEQM